MKKKQGFNRRAILRILTLERLGVAEIEVNV